MRIAVVAPSNPLPPDVPPRVHALAGDQADIVFHPQCFLSEGHFAGPDSAREDALVEAASDPAFDAVWFARGGYGANRIAERAIARLGGSARDKVFMGYSDTGFLLAGLLTRGIGRPVHGPMPSDINRPGGEAAVSRALDGLIDQEPAPHRQLAFNLTVLSNLLGTPLQPDLAGRVLMIEEVDEPMYAIDRMLFHVTSNPAVRGCAGIKVGRFAPISPNVPDFGIDEVEVARHWCTVSGIPYLGRADIGHDVDNQVVPFG